LKGSVLISDSFHPENGVDTFLRYVGSNKKHNEDTSQKVAFFIIAVLKTSNITLTTNIRDFCNVTPCR
jgi:hypothetical protein